MLPVAPKKCLVLSFLLIFVISLIVVLRQPGRFWWTTWTSSAGDSQATTRGSPLTTSPLKAEHEDSDGSKLTENSPAVGEGLSKEVVEGVKKYVFFLGWPRSGHSIVASLLNAHPNMAISNVYNVRIQNPTTKHLLFNGIYLMSIPSINSDLTTEKKGYSLTVENSWQGKFHHLQVIGGKMGGPKAKLGPEAYNSNYTILAKLVGIPIRIICVVRNPFDIISTMLLYGEMNTEWKKKLAAGEISETNKASFSSTRFYKTIKVVFESANTVKEHDGRAIIVHNVDFVHDTRDTMKQLCTFLEVECYEFYLQQCQEKVFGELSKSRKLVNWSQEQINEVERKMKDYHFFDIYSFHGDD